MHDTFLVLYSSAAIGETDQKRRVGEQSVLISDQGESTCVLTSSVLNFNLLLNDGHVYCSIFIELRQWRIQWVGGGRH